jgi:hypothetical protein
VLRRFTYLDTEALGQYVAAVEGGLRQESTTTDRRDQSTGAAIDARVARLDASGAHAVGESLRFEDTNESRFARLMEVGRSRSDELDWLEVLEADDAFSAAAIGTMVEWECDLFVPDVVQMLAKAGGMLDALRAFTDLAPLMETLGADVSDGLPNADELRAASGVVEAMDTKLVIVGDDPDADWQISATLDPEFVRGDIEGRARIVGKVARKVPSGRWKPFVTFPGMNVLPRRQRRDMERAPIPEGKEDEYLMGPALILDMLAIYR